MTRRIRLTVVMTHPVQYYAPWFRHIERSAPELDLTVLYAVDPSPDDQGAGFGVAFRWDVPLRDGYRSVVARPWTDRVDLRSSRFRGVDVPEIDRHLLDTNADVVLLNGWHSVTQWRALRLCAKHDIPLLYRGDSHLANRAHGLRHAPWRLRSRWLLSRFDAYLSVGKRAFEYLLCLGASREAVFPSPHAVDNCFFRNAAAPFREPVARETARKELGFIPSDFIALYVGKLEPKKRPLDWIRAIAKAGKDVAGLAVGTGPLDAACKALSKELDVRVRWAGFVNQSELGQFYAVADCLVLPSDWGETWGLVVNEAMATGLPCVVSDRVGCAPDLVESGQTGEIYPMGDIGVLASTLRRLVEEKRRGVNRAGACLNKIHEYNFEAATKGLAAACAAVIR